MGFFKVKEKLSVSLVADPTDRGIWVLLIS